MSTKNQPKTDAQPASADPLVVRFTLTDEQYATITAAAEGRWVLAEAQPAIDAERERVGRILVQVARNEGLCETFDRLWQYAWPGTQARDENGYDCRGWRIDPDDDTREVRSYGDSTRPRMPQDGHAYLWRSYSGWERVNREDY